MKALADLFAAFGSTLVDILPIVIIVFGFQWFAFRRPIANPRRILTGFIYVIVGMTLFLVGLEEALFPVGRLMAQQLTAPDFLGIGHDDAQWSHYIWVYLFAAAIGFATTIAEPALIAVAYKANQVSAGAVNAWALRVAVGLGVGAGLALGALRIVTGTPLHLIIMVGYIVVIVQTFFAPRQIIALAYDSGGVTTSTVTVPIVTALGLGLAGTISGRSQLLDGFGLIAFASLFPIITVLGYAQFAEWRLRKLKKRDDAESPEPE
ncbi:MAG: DUF1538 domain-containing protein [Gammaproteobacteria bacterium]|nr:DUF1538 domain-containing protein [Gammaproteobacteria bacterium]